MATITKQNQNQEEEKQVEEIETKNVNTDVEVKGKVNAPKQYNSIYDTCGEKILTEMNKIITGMKKYESTNNIFSNITQAWRDFIQIDTMRSEIAFLNRTLEVPNSCGVSQFYRYDAAPNRNNTLVHLHILRLVQTARVERVLIASPTIFAMADGFDGAAMTGTITSNLRTDTEHYAAKVPVNFARAFGTKPSNIGVKTDTSLIYLKILLYIMSRNARSGSSDISMVQQCEAIFGSTSRAGVFWPWSPQNAAVLPAINARMVSLEDYTKHITGSATTVVGWEATRWGNDIAIVPIRLSDMQNSDVNAAWTLAFMQYPIVRHVDNKDQYWNRVIDVNGSTADHSPFSNMTTISGPIANVIYVIVDLMNRGGDISIAVGNVAVTSAANYLNAAGANVAITAAIQAEGQNIDDDANMLGALSRAQAMFPDIMSYRNALFTTAECSFMFPYLPSRCNANPNPIYVSADSAGFVLPALVNYPGYTLLTGSAPVDNMKKVATTMLGVVRREAANDNAYTNATHTIPATNHIAYCAYASRYYNMGMDSFSVPSHGLDLFFNMMEYSCVVAACRDIGASARGMQDWFNHGIQNFNTGRQLLASYQRSVRRTLEMMSLYCIPTFDSCYDNVPINALRQQVIFGTTVYYPANRMSWKALAYYAGMEQSMIPTEQTLKLTTKVEYTRPVLGGAIVASSKFVDITINKPFGLKVHDEVIKLSHQVNPTSNPNWIVVSNGLGVVGYQGILTTPPYTGKSIQDSISVVGDNETNEIQISVDYCGAGFIPNMIDYVTGNKLFLGSFATTKNYIHPNKGIMAISPYYKEAMNYDNYWGNSQDEEGFTMNDMFGEDSSTSSTGSGV